MAFTYDLGTDIGKIRLAITDTTEASPVFSDEEIQVFLDESDGDLDKAAARALRAIATSLVRMSKVVKREGFEGQRFSAADFLAVADAVEKQGIGFAIGSTESGESFSYRNPKATEFDSNGDVAE